MFPGVDGATTYHRGYAAGGRRRFVSTTGCPSTRSGMPPMTAAFFETGGVKGGDRGSVAYRGSLLSSTTTTSSNQDELLQAYEYGRKQFMPVASTGATIQQPVLTAAKKASVSALPFFLFLTRSSDGKRRAFL